ncbi:MAG: hypothetical protein MMC33_004421 [Icmadophila ericetorum]|nr:hypothetical protein [Icmadophila ericetorum]
MLWVTSHFWIAELILIINFFNLTTLYFRHPYTNRLAHAAVTAGPLAWTYVAIFLTGAAMVGATSLAARIVANVFVWSFLGFGLSFLVAFQDYILGFAMSILTASLAVHQFNKKHFALQWIFAIAIASTLFIATLGIAIPKYFGKDVTFKRSDNGILPDTERQPLLSE